MQKITLELDLDRPDDLQLLAVISKYKAEQAQGKEPDLKSVVARTVGSQFPNTTALQESAKEITKASQELGNTIGERTTMTTKERASIAAKARWAQERARKSGQPQPPAAVVKKKTKARSEEGFDGAEEQPLAQFPTQSAQDFVFNQIEDRPPFPDGRELIDGSWRQAMPHSAEESHIPEGTEDDLEEARRIARDYQAT